jgi:uncharacterized protein (DUF488 family)
MATVYTIGTTRTSLEGFITALQQAGVDAVVDVRLRNTSHLAGFAKRDDLAFLLQTGFGIALLDAYRADGDWEALARAFLPLLAERRAEELGRDVLSRAARPCLLCAEHDAEGCHRRLVAEYWARHIPNLVIVHLP